MALKIEAFDNVANGCNHFYNAYIQKDVTINNGYNCSHPAQEEFETVNNEKIGKCYCFSCPLGCEADAEDFLDPKKNQQGFDTFEEGQFILLEGDKQYGKEKYSYE